MKKTTIFAGAGALVVLQVASTYWIVNHRPSEPAEVFADSMHQLRFDGRVLHIEFARSRIELTQGRRPTAGEREVVARIAVASDAAVALYAGMGKALGAIRPAPVFEAPRTTQESEPKGTL